MLLFGTCNERQAGFTLIELMIVISIMGLLAAFTVPQYEQFVAKTKQAEARNLLSGMHMSLETFHAEFNMYYPDFRAIAFEPTGRMTYNVGFSGPGSFAGPARHPTPMFRGPAGVNYVNSARACAQPEFTCSTSHTGNPPGFIAGAGIWYRAGASANIDSDAGVDMWTIDSNKVFVNLYDDNGDVWTPTGG